MNRLINNRSDNRAEKSFIMASATTTVDIATKPEQVTYGLIVKRVPDGTDASGETKYKTTLRAISRESEIEEAKALTTPGNEKYDSNVHFQEQTFSYEKAMTLAGISEVIKDADEAIKIFNAGLKVRFNSKVVGTLTATDDEGNPAFEFQTGSVDMRGVLNEPTSTRGLSPTDKALKTLAGTGVDASVLAQIQALLAQQSAQ